MVNRKFKISIVVLLLFLVGSYFIYQSYRKIGLGNYQNVIVNYGKEIDIAAARYDVSPAFLRSLCALESSGKSSPGSRFEPHVYERLKKLKRGEISVYDGLNPTDLANCSDDALRNLATSWGPFQLMGYKCLELGIAVNDLRGEKSVEHSVKWISKSYGHLIRAKKYEDAFHFHNTGRLVPTIGRYLTHDKSYIPRGIKYMQYFVKKE
jgi:hypothetical protein